MSDQPVAEAANYVTHNEKQTNMYALSWIRTRDPSSRVAAELHLRPHGDRDWQRLRIMPPFFFWGEIVALNRIQKFSVAELMNKTTLAAKCHCDIFINTCLFTAVCVQRNVFVAILVRNNWLNIMHFDRGFLLEWLKYTSIKNSEEYSHFRDVK